MHALRQQFTPSRLSLLLLASLPFLVYLAAEFAPGPISKLIRLGLVGLVAGVVAVAIFVRPREGTLFMIFHVYAGLGFLLPGAAALMVTAILCVAAVLGFTRGEEFRMGDVALWWGYRYFYRSVPSVNALCVRSACCRRHV